MSLALLSETLTLYNRKTQSYRIFFSFFDPFLSNLIETMSHGIGYAGCDVNTVGVGVATSGILIFLQLFAIYNNFFNAIAKILDSLSKQFTVVDVWHMFIHKISGAVDEITRLRALTTSLNFSGIGRALVRVRFAHVSTKRLGPWEFLQTELAFEDFVHWNRCRK